MTTNGPTKWSLNFLVPCSRRFFVNNRTLSPTVYSTAWYQASRTSSDTLMLAANDATLTHKVLTNFALNLTQPIPGADHPSGPQACATAIQT